MILSITIFYKQFNDFKRRIQCLKTILIILNPNFSKKKRQKFWFSVTKEKSIWEYNLHQLKNLWCKCFSMHACSASGDTTGKQNSVQKKPSIFQSFGSVHPSESGTIALFYGESGESELDKKGNVFNTFNMQDRYLFPFSSIITLIDAN